MSVGVVTPIVPDANDLLLGEGVYYINLGEAGEAILGPSQGGGKLAFIKKNKETNYDGKNGSTKGLNRIEEFYPQLTVNLLKLTYLTLGYGVPSTVTDMGTYYKFRFDLPIVAADVLLNVGFVGVKADGKPCRLVVKNALNDGPIALNFKSKSEVVAEMQYTGYYAYATPTVPSFEGREYDV